MAVTPAAATQPAPVAAPTLEVRNLRTHFFTRAGVVKAVDDVSFTLAQGTITGLIGAILIALSLWWSVRWNRRHPEAVVPARAFRGHLKVGSEIYDASLEGKIADLLDALARAPA